MTAHMVADAVRLTSFSHGGGCGCKIAPGVLAEILRSPGSHGVPFAIPPQLLVGLETADDAAVYQLNDQQALIATTDFFMPIDRLPLDVIRRILQGGESICAEAGIPVAGGHTIDSVEPIYGLVALGLVHPGRIKRNASARAGDRLVLGKPLGVGILSAALKKNRLDEAGYRRMIDSTTRLNTPGRTLAELDGVHAMTDVTGFGLLGHALEMARGAGLRATLDFSALPLVDGVLELARGGCITGASGRNWTGYCDDVTLASGIDPVMQAVLTDPQTSGGLLVACEAAAVDDVVRHFKQEGFAQAREIGGFQDGPAGVTVYQ